MAGRKGARCYRHAGLAVTSAQRRAVRYNAAKHGERFADPFASLNCDDDIDSEVLRELCALLMIRARRWMHWEGATGQVAWETSAAFDQLTNMLDRWERAERREALVAAMRRALGTRSPAPQPPAPEWPMRIDAGWLEDHSPPPMVLPRLLSNVGGATA
ncbi:MAG TPA: hypothetical protein VGR28_13380 [Candidatus Thermoplasmatota archaeon]|jgi:hypothetical protein|nr:hypothetical protein [Candidatus Thermoplasmatota archaeon]